MKTRTIAAAVAASFFVAGAACAQGLTNGALLYNGFNPNELVALATELGYQASAQASPDGARTVVTITVQGGTFYASPTVCNAGKCSGLDIFAFFGQAGSTPLATLNAFNQRSFPKVFIQEGVLVMSRYPIADFGVPKGNVASEFVNFINSAFDFATLLQSGANTISAKIETPQSAGEPVTEDPVTASFTADAKHSEEFEALTADLIANGAKSFRE